MRGKSKPIDRLISWPNPWTTTSYRLEVKVRLTHIRVHTIYDGYQDVLLEVWPGARIPDVATLEGYLRSFERQRVYHEYMANCAAHEIFEAIQPTRIRLTVSARLSKGSTFVVVVDSATWVS